MKLFINVSILGATASSDMLSEAQAAVKEQLSDEGISKSSALSNCIFGSDQPEIVKAEASTWNDSIRKDLMDAIEEVKQSATACTASSAAVIPLDTEHTFHLSLAARAADDNFTPFGKHGVLDDNGCGWPAFNVVLTPGQLRDIMEKPENWMVADIIPL